MFRHLRVHWEYLKIALKSALEYRTNFIVQVLSMALNDVVWIVFWLIIFSKFSSIGGWNLQDMMTLYVVVLTSYGLSGILFGNRGQIPVIITQGKLDYYLTLPKNTLYHLLTSRSSFYSIGDFILGVILAAIVLEPAQIPLCIVLVITSAMIINAYGVLVGSLAFYIGSAEETCRTLSFSLIAMASYPLSIYHGVARVIILFIIPAGFVSGVPVELLRTFNWQWMLYTIGFAVLLTIIAVIVFYQGVKKYESGNMINVRI